MIKILCDKCKEEIKEDEDVMEVEVKTGKESGKMKLCRKCVIKLLELL